ncbi:MAG: rhodanese-like domain-containing protein [Actinomycetota bacterium]|nr:rhodanese-like domain-containing protein [Actinomycetota bacterium]
METPEIDVAELARRWEAGATVVDVRRPDEYETGHVPGAKLVTLEDVPSRQEEISAEDEVLVICKTGGRSRQATEYLRQQGVHAVNVAGGTLAWIEAGHPVVTGDQPN